MTEWRDALHKAEVPVGHVSVEETDRSSDAGRKRASGEDRKTPEGEPTVSPLEANTGQSG